MADGPSYLTVGELAAILARYPQDAPVFYACQDNYYSGALQAGCIEPGKIQLFKSTTQGREPFWMLTDDAEFYVLDPISEPTLCLVVKDPGS